MAATLDIYQMLEIIGLGGGNESKATKFTKGVTPAEIVSGRPIIGNTAYILDLGDIAIGSGFCLYLESIVGSLYVTLGLSTWADATNYVVGNIVTYSDTEYVCIVAHLSEASGGTHEEPDTNTIDWIASTTNPAANLSHLYISEGEGYIIPINYNATAMPGIRILSNNANGQISYKLIGS